MKKTTFTRQELYELVWSESMLSLSKKYNISDTALRKICKRMNIPLPPLALGCIAVRRSVLLLLFQKATCLHAYFKNLLQFLHNSWNTFSLYLLNPLKKEVNHETT